VNASRVMIAMPTRGTAFVPAVLQVVELGRRWGTAPVFEIGGPVHVVRRRIAERFLSSTASHLLTVDDDVVAPEDGVERLLELDVSVAAGVYPLVVGRAIRASARRVDEAEWPATPPPEVFEAEAVGFGFTLIRRDAFERTRRPWFMFGAAPGGQPIGEDVWFCNGVRAAGHVIRCDGRLTCAHMRGGEDLRRLAGWMSST
jgi:hypothetical protein